MRRDSKIPAFAGMTPSIFAYAGVTLGFDGIAGLLPVRHAAVTNANDMVESLEIQIGR